MTAILVLVIVVLSIIVVVQQRLWKQTIDDWGKTIELLEQRIKDEK